jgi:serine/threonine protein kinase/ankyrin repeat protein
MPLGSHQVVAAGSAVLASSHPLHAAAAANRPQEVKSLIERGHDPNTRDSDGDTPIIAGIEHQQVIRTLIRGGANPRVRQSDDAGTTPLHIAAIRGLISTARELMSAGANPAELAPWPCRHPPAGLEGDLVTCLHVAAAAGQVEFVRWMCRERRYLVNRTSEKGWYALHVGVLCAQVAVCNDLVDADASVLSTVPELSSTSGGRGFLTLEDIALLSGRVEMMKWERRVRRSITDKRKQHSNIVNSLHTAAAGGDVDRLREYADSGYDLNTALRKDSATLAHSAARAGCVETLLYLLVDAPRPLDCRARLASTEEEPLHLAAAGGHTDAVAALLSRCPVDLDAVDRRGLTALAHAQRKHHEECSALLRAAQISLGNTLPPPVPVVTEAVMGVPWAGEAEDSLGGHSRSRRRARHGRRRRDDMSLAEAARLIPSKPFEVKLDEAARGTSDDASSSNATSVALETVMEAPVVLDSKRGTPFAGTPQERAQTWLEALELGQYAEALAKLGFDTLPRLGMLREEDLATMGMLSGHERQLLRAAQTLTNAASAHVLTASELVAPRFSTTPRAPISNVASYGEFDMDSRSSTSQKEGLPEVERNQSAPPRTGESHEPPTVSGRVVSAPPTGSGDEDEAASIMHSSTSSSSVQEQGWRVIRFDDLEFAEDPQLGEGSFGTVLKAKWRGMMVAVKVLRVESDALSVATSVLDKARRTSSGSSSALQTAIEELRKEATVMSRVAHHDNIVRFVGVVEDPFPAVVTQFMSRGSLEKMLVGPGAVATRRVTSLTEAVRMMEDAAAGILHLHEERVIHRDIAARNLLCDDAGRVRVCDFGFARLKRSQQSRGYTATTTGPIRWLAPEALLSGSKVFSEKSDVWSFGVALGEVFTGSQPWGDMETIGVAMRVCSGERQSLPRALPDVLLDLIGQCWAQEAADRPTMRDVYDSLTNIRRWLEKWTAAGAITLGALDDAGDVRPRALSIAEQALSEGGSDLIPEIAPPTTPLREGWVSAVASQGKRTVQVARATASIAASGVGGGNYADTVAIMAEASPTPAWGGRAWGRGGGSQRGENG